MRLFTKEIDKKLFSQFKYGSDLSKQKVVAKIFNAYGKGTWYLLNSDPSDPDYIWAIVDMFEVEMGSVSRNELETVKVPPFRLPLERDLHFQEVNAKELWDGLMQGKHYAKGGLTVGTNVHITDPKSMFKGKTGFISEDMGRDYLVTILVDGNERNVLVSKKGIEVIEETEYEPGGYMDNKIKLSDVVEGAKFKNKDGIVFIVDKVTKDEIFKPSGISVSSSLEDGKKGNYRNELNDFVEFLNEQESIKINSSNIDINHMDRGGKTNKSIHLTLVSREKTPFGITEYKQDNTNNIIQFKAGKEPFTYSIVKMSDDLKPHYQDILDTYVYQGVKQHDYKGGFDEAIKHLDTSKIYEDDEYMSKGGKTKNWIQGAIKHKGALRTKAKKEGLIHGDEKLSMADLKKLEKEGGKTGKRAHLAETLKRIRSKNAGK